MYEYQFLNKTGNFNGFMTFVNTLIYAACSLCDKNIAHFFVNFSSVFENIRAHIDGFIPVICPEI